MRKMNIEDHAQFTFSFAEIVSTTFHWHFRAGAGDSDAIVGRVTMGCQNSRDTQKRTHHFLEPPTFLRLTKSRNNYKGEYK
jgi:hypothetical protein